MNYLLHLTFLSSLSFSFAQIPAQNFWDSFQSTSITYQTSPTESHIFAEQTISPTVNEPNISSSIYQSSDTIYGLNGTESVIMTTPGFVYGQTKIRGVNLGSWLVLESFIVPTMFNNLPAHVVDEFTFSSYYGPVEGACVLQKHWQTFITEDDFVQIAAAGLNHVRIPVGYWSLIPLQPSEPYIVGALDYLKQGVMWANDHGISVMLDLHSAPGSQNGFDNSGKYSLPRNPEWFGNQAAVERTLDALKVLMTEFSDPKYNNTVTSIAVLNEPMDWAIDTLPQLKSFYEAAYLDIRAINPSILIIYSEAFRGLGSWDTFQATSNYTNTAIDYHFYIIFSGGGQIGGLTEQQILDSACGQGKAMSIANQVHPVFVGEWSLAVTDCAQNLNTRGNGARYEGYDNSPIRGNCEQWTGRAENFAQEYRNFLALQFEVKTSAWDLGYGWVYWTWKTDAGFAEEWSYQKGLQWGWIPKDPTAKPHGGSCSSGLV